MTGPGSFADDPLRLLRAARFSSVLGFRIDPEIYIIAKDVDLSDLSAERVTEEWFRILARIGFTFKRNARIFQIDHT